MEIKYETDSRKIRPGQTFVAIKGFNVDGHDYVEEALKNGATEVVVERYVHGPNKLLLVKSTKEYLSERIMREYDIYLKDIKFIGVTGTNGKTTTCFLTYQMLLQLGMNVAYIGTIGFFHKDEYIELNNTTPDILALYKLIMKAEENGAKYIIMEVSSHALELGRINGIKFETAGFTNLTQDHLDFHGNMANYLNAKLKLTEYLKRDNQLILNGDDSAHEEFKKRHLSTTIGLNGNIKIVRYLIKDGKTIIKFKANDKEYKVQTNLIGKFNVYNYLMSLALVHELGFSIEDIIDKTSVFPPKGRLETINCPKGLTIIDYAHTPDAVEKVINECRELCEGRIITILGCGGNRDKTKRPIMGRLATNNSDYVIFTNDNPRNEDPLVIINDIIQNNESSNYKIIYDRSKAIQEGIDFLEPEDMLLILGKGHEDYQIIGDIKHHFDDAEEVKKYIEGKIKKSIV